MPDQSTAAEEHALISEISHPLDELYDDPMPPESDVDFPVVLRGYDRFAVDAYVKQVGKRIVDLEESHEPDAAVRRALERVGEEVSGILQRAHETAARITTNSRREAEDRLERARQEASEITAAAQRRLAEIDADADRIWVERARIIDDARGLAVQLTSLADSAAERFPPAPPEEEVETAELEATRRSGSVITPVAADPPPEASDGSEATAEGRGDAQPPQGEEPRESDEDVLDAGDGGTAAQAWEPPATAEWPASGRGAWGEAPAPGNGSGNGALPESP